VKPVRDDEAVAGPVQPAEAGPVLRVKTVREPAGRTRGMAWQVLTTVGPPVAVAALFIGIWLLFSYVLFDPTQRFLLPPPQQVVKVGFLDWSHLHEVLKDGLLPTTQVALTGLVIAIAVGMTLAIAMSQAPWIERSIYPYAVIVQTIPIIAIVPLIGFILNYNFKSRVLACVMISIFPIITNTLFGLKSAEASLQDLFTLHGAGRLTRLRKLQLPAAMPAIFTGFRISAGLSVIGAIVGDFFFRQGNPGIGRLIDKYRAQLQGEQLITAIFFSSLLGIVVFWGFGSLGSRLTRSWHESAQEPKRTKWRRPPERARGGEAA
jgi:NitT/TauT family transport system permease protein